MAGISVIVSATQYTMDVFDRVNDSRFWKSFITTYGCNNTKGAPDWTEADIRSGKAPVGVSAGDKRFTGGELASSILSTIREILATKTMNLVTKM